jgi:hypothetical protein
MKPILPVFIKIFYVQIDRNRLIITNVNRKLDGSFNLFFRKRVLMHLMPEAEGGYTQIGRRAIRELAFGGLGAAGVADVFLAEGPNDQLTKENLLKTMDSRFIA